MNIMNTNKSKLSINNRSFNNIINTSPVCRMKLGFLAMVYCSGSPLLHSPLSHQLLQYQASCFIQCFVGYLHISWYIEVYKFVQSAINFVFVKQSMGNLDVENFNGSWFIAVTSVQNVQSQILIDKSWTKSWKISSAYCNGQSNLQLHQLIKSVKVTKTMLHKISGKIKCIFSLWTDTKDISNHL